MSEALENTFGALALALTDEVNAALGTDGFLPSEFEAIGHLGHAPGLTIKDLANTVALSHAATVRLVGRLEAKELVLREKSSTDGRSVTLKLSSNGYKLYKNLLTQRQEILSRALRGLNADERKTLTYLSNRILREILRNEQHAFRICRLCNQPICEDCPVEAEMVEREARQLRLSGET